jgi:hypothetical protein
LRSERHGIDNAASCLDGGHTKTGVVQKSFICHLVPNQHPCHAVVKEDVTIHELSTLPEMMYIAHAATVRQVKIPGAYTKPIVRKSHIAGDVLVIETPTL